MIVAYAHKGCLDQSRELFNSLESRDPSSWTAMIEAHACNGQSKEALETFWQMNQDGIDADEITFISVLHSCSHTGMVEKSLHQFARALFDAIARPDVVAWNTMIEAYANAGQLDQARALFDAMPVDKNVVSWTVMLTGYSQLGQYERALGIFQRMDLDGIQQDDMTLTAILSACSHVGLVGPSKLHFSSMLADYGVTPRIEHYQCMVAILGRAGELGKCEELVGRMPIAPDVGAWKNLLGACSIHGDVDRGDVAANAAAEMDPSNEVPYLLLSNIVRG
ncbi:hypothetical protein SELMODRAFT_115449 [Selaginella moellendorffii]|uniref:Pentatricopeptide repeat-containing protein-mitochondrial domain-containing protein n=1 Tax=Selaginella moellendorffii TaxID=88036 RepID=D8SF67_SELML|nr:hypothetical protein SELMODRAFT_115449 [Selaginella moellendorffii]